MKTNAQLWIKWTHQRHQNALAPKRSTFYEDNKSKCNSLVIYLKQANFRVIDRHWFLCDLIKVSSFCDKNCFYVKLSWQFDAKPQERISGQIAKITAVKYWRPNLTLVFDLWDLKPRPNGLILDLFCWAIFPVCGDFSKVSASYPNRGT